MKPVDLEELAALYSSARDHEAMASALRREGERRIVVAQRAGVPVEQIAHAAGLTHQRVYQVLRAAGIRLMRERRYSGPCTPEETRRWRSAYDIERKYGVTPEDYEDRVERQEGRCAVCRRRCTPAGIADAEAPTFVVDHSHATGRVRDLLCMRCNQVLGRCGDDPELLLGLADYLIGHADVKATASVTPS